MKRSHGGNMATNCFLATINDRLGPGTKLDDPGISDFVHEMRVDLDIWFECVTC